MGRGGAGQNLGLCEAEGAGVVLAGLQPRFDAVSVDGVGAAQWVAALAIHQVLAYQTEFTGPAGVAAPCWPVHRRKWPLDWVLGQWPADGSWRGLASPQQKPDLLRGFVDGHARQRATGALHLLEKRYQLSTVALREASPQLLQDVHGTGSTGGRCRRSCGMGRLCRRHRRRVETMRWKVGRWRTVAALLVLEKVRRRVLLLLQVQKPLGREGPVQQIWRRRHELRLGQWRHHLPKFQVSLLKKTKVKNIYGHTG